MLEIGKRVRITGDSVDDFKYFSLGAEGIIVSQPPNGEHGWYVCFDKGLYDNRCDSSWYVQPEDMEVIDD